MLSIKSHSEGRRACTPRIVLAEPEVFNRAVLDFLTAVDAGKWTRRNPASQTGSAVLPAETR